MNSKTHAQCTPNVPNWLHNSSAMPSGSSKMGHDATIGARRGKQCSQDGPKGAPRGVWRAPRAAHGPPRSLQGAPWERPECPKRCQEEPKRAPRGPKRAPEEAREPPEAPRGPLGAPKWEPRGARRAPRGTQDDPRGLQRRSGKPKMRKAKTLKKQMVFIVFGASWPPQEGSKGAHLEPLGELPGDLGATWGGLVGSQVIAKLFKRGLSEV